VERWFVALPDDDATTPSQLVGESLDLTTAQGYALEAEIARRREQSGAKK
jgi:hypothetical protein